MARFVKVTASMATKPRDLCERTFEFARDIVGLCRALSHEPGVSRQIAGQLLRAGTSVGANAEEAKAAYTRREFACKNSIVLRESREALYWLRLITAHKLAPAAVLEPLLKEANELVAIYTVTVRRARLPLKS
ncbi:MAG: four helix bundle protein [Vicinamibacterales bacterium]|nr:four helix bundle protein [Vicinamibacterales bacterium]